MVSKKNDLPQKSDLLATSVGTLLFLLIAGLNPFPAKANIWDDITEPIVGRCGLVGEGHITVVNQLGTPIYAVIDKNDKAGGPFSADLAPGHSMRKPICNRTGARVVVYTSTNCGKTFLAKSRLDRVYNEETIRILPSGFSYDVGDLLDVGGRVGGLVVTAIASYYRVPPQALSELGVNEATVISACSEGGLKCAQAVYKYLPSDLLTTIKADRCLSKAFDVGTPAQVDVPCRNVYSQDFSWRQLSRTGRVLINNQRSSPVQITLIHPDSTSKFADWTVAASNRTFLVFNNQPFYVGDDWGIQVGGGCVFYVGEVGIYNSQTYEITLSDPAKISLSGLHSPYSP